MPLLDRSNGAEGQIAAMSARDGIVEHIAVAFTGSIQNRFVARESFVGWRLFDLDTGAEVQEVVSASELDGEYAVLNRNVMGTISPAMPTRFVFSRVLLIPPGAELPAIVIDHFSATLEMLRTMEWQREQRKAG